MDIQTKLTVLKQIYDVYADFGETLDTVCRKGCADCCTANVALTTLEGYWIVTELTAAGKTDLLHKIRPHDHPERFSPAVSTNAMADLCARGEDPPQETPHAGQAPCPLLGADTCPVYPYRPFGCRCMVSKTRCRDTGYADMASFTLTVNTVFQQTIEHVDAAGCYGNFMDVLLLLRSAETREHYQSGRIDCGTAALAPNHPLKTLMVPPEHRQRIQPLLQALSSIKT